MVEASNDTLVSSTDAENCSPEVVYKLPPFNVKVCASVQESTTSAAAPKKPENAFCLLFFAMFALIPRMIGSSTVVAVGLGTAVVVTVAVTVLKTVLVPVMIVLMVVGA